MKRSLLDISLLVALLDSDHIFHTEATRWFLQYGQDGWASCPITQNGCLRIMSNPAYPNPRPVRAVRERLAEAVAGPFHVFWPDDISLFDDSRFDPGKIHGPRQLTDLYFMPSRFAMRGDS